MKKRNPYLDVLVIAAGFLVLYLIFKKAAFLYIASGVAIGSAISECITQKIAWAWEKFALGLGYVNSRIFLSLIFFLFLTPLAMLYRLRKHDALQLQKKKNGSYFTEREHLYVKNDLERM